MQTISDEKRERKKERREFELRLISAQESRDAEERSTAALLGLEGELGRLQGQVSSLRHSQRSEAEGSEVGALRAMVARLKRQKR